MTNALRARALAFLARRDYSRMALRRKLLPFAEANGFSEEGVDTLLDDLRTQGLLSDARYAKERARQRGVLYGNARLTAELGGEGITGDTLSEALQEAGREDTRCRAVWQKKFGMQPANMQEGAKQARFLRGRGFSSASIRAVLRTRETEDV
ncbi:MAG: recombination regulator RecX [Zoogloeaceae bacterium]|jgi:regulatory protein|nr:recombination regulator RecX [Zoogloeaceae bacterium]